MPGVKYKAICLLDEATIKVYTRQIFRRNLVIQKKYTPKNSSKNTKSITAFVFIYFFSHWASVGHFLGDRLSYLMIKHCPLLQLQLEGPWELCNEFESLITAEHPWTIDSIDQNPLVRVQFGIDKIFLITDNYFLSHMQSEPSENGEYLIYFTEKVTKQFNVFPHLISY